MAQVLANLENISKKYKGLTALKGVNLTIPQGVLFGLIGPDGAGKSTLLKIIAGVLTYDGGYLEVFGKPVTNERQAEAIKDKICFMPQGLGVNLYQELSVEENLEFFGKLRLLPSAKLKIRKKELLELTGLWPFRHRRAKNLSGGMKQKLALACSLVHRPEFIILDEPTTGVDPLSREDFWALLTSLVSGQGVTALVSTTYLEEADRFEKLALLHQGEICAQGTLKDILGLVEGRPFVLKTSEPLELLERLLAHGLRPFPYTGGLRIFVPGNHPEAQLSKIISGLKVQIEPLPLEIQDVVLGLTKGSEMPDIHLSPKSLRVKKGQNIAIEARSLTRDFQGFLAVDHVDLEVKSGEIYGLLGPNGAGKTTLIRMLCGLLPPTSGRGQVAGYNMQEAPGAIKEHIGYLSQAFSLYQDLTVTENIWLMAGIYGLGARRTKERIKELLQLTGLEAYKYHKTVDLPLGLRQRLALACAIVHQPDIVFLDEPTSGMDVAGRQVFWTLIYRLSRAIGLTCLVTTHYLAEAEYCDGLTLMHRGRVVAQGPPQRLKKKVEDRLGRPWLAKIEDPWRVREIFHTKGVPVSVMGRSVRFFLKGTRQEVLSVLSRWGITPLELERGTITMEDVFLYFVRSSHET